MRPPQRNVSSAEQTKRGIGPPNLGKGRWRDCKHGRARASGIAGRLPIFCSVLVVVMTLAGCRVHWRRVLVQLPSREACSSSPAASLVGGLGIPVEFWSSCLSRSEGCRRKGGPLLRCVRQWRGYAVGEVDWMNLSGLPIRSPGSTPTPMAHRHSSSGSWRSFDLKRQRLLPFAPATTQLRSSRPPR